MSHSVPSPTPVPLPNNSSHSDKDSKSQLPLLLYSLYRAPNCIHLFDPQHNLTGKPKGNLTYQRYMRNGWQNISRLQKPSCLSLVASCFLIPKCLLISKPKFSYFRTALNYPLRGKMAPTTSNHTNMFTFANDLRCFIIATHYVTLFKRWS